MKRHLRLSRITSPPPALPRVTASISTTPPFTPWSGPSTSASDGCVSPQTSRFLLTGIGSSFGGVPTNFRVPATAPPSTTVTTSYAAPGPGAVSASTARRTSARVRGYCVLERQPEAPAVPEEPDRKHHDHREPQGELRRGRELRERPEQEVAADHDDRRHRVVDVDRADEVALGSLEGETAGRAGGRHPEGPSEQRAPAAAGTHEARRPPEGTPRADDSTLGRHGPPGNSSPAPLSASGARSRRPSRPPCASRRRGRPGGAGTRGASRS